MEMPVKRTPLPTIAGIFCIIEGCFKLLGFVIFLAVSFFIPVGRGGFPFNVAFLAIPLGILAAAAGVLAIVGGAYALQRRNFGLALTGSIAALLPFSPFALLGLASVILVALSHDEFGKPQAESAPPAQ